MSRALSLNPQLFGKPSFVPLSPTNVARGTHGHAGGALLDDRRIVVPWPLQELGGYRPPCAAGRAQPLTETSIFESAHQTQSIGRDFLRSGSLSRDPRAAGDVACTAGGRSWKSRSTGERLDVFARWGRRPSRLRRLDVVDGHLAAAAVFGSVEGNLLTFCKTTQASALKSRCMDEHVLAAVIRLDEAEAFHVVVEFHSARNHEGCLSRLL
jgi:hypothetical protein